MMYAIIGAALQDVNSENIPTDYLAFFCLGKVLLVLNSLRVDLGFPNA